MRDYILTSDDTNNRDEPEENVKNNNIIDAKNIDIKVVNNQDIDIVKIGKLKVLSNNVEVKVIGYNNDKYTVTNFEAENNTINLCDNENLKVIKKSNVKTIFFI